ncbi:DUF4254 domain-containing protein [Streptomyces varsoviensis]|uniref:DUF4254 domain-containing protein n=1 Tax=Streptomyces varsoviensis TaxID=67373 RepID=A0ABR5JE83_9ACTN|nr:DUF4254 domain-containing protein [Streptomyces varsoviensis]KOG91759.1 hypothetical protein ADK38_01390 [Streptomyces varsoviensis]
MHIDDALRTVPGALAPPRAASILGGFGAADAEQDDHPVLAIARELCGQHRRQWEAEDLSRAPAADAQTLAAVKRTIDALNSRRGSLIDALDEWAGRSLRQNPRAPLHTETLGSVVDRLCIAWVRAEMLRPKTPPAPPPGPAAQGAPPADGGPAARGESAARQLAELAFAYDTLTEEIAAGLRRVPDWRLLKSYG